MTAGGLNDAVRALLRAISRALKLVESHQEQPSTHSDVLHAGHLSTSLKRSRQALKKAHSKTVAREASAYRDGDEQSHNSLSALIKGFTLAFRSIIERLSRGHATPMDYQTLLSLSEIASKEALVNWEDVSDGFSYRQASLRSTKQAKKSRGSNSKRSLRSKSSRSTGSHHSREPSSQDQRASNIERPHHKRRASTISSEAHSSTSPPSRKRHKSKGSKSSTAFTSNKRTLSTSPRNSLRKSGTSFTSVSTKLGEIPASKLTRNESYAVAYPMKPYVKPGKDSRLKRWFRG